MPSEEIIVLFVQINIVLLGDVGLQMCQFVRPSSVTDDLRGRYHAIPGHEKLVSIFEDVLTAETGLTINIFLLYWLIYSRTSPHDELPLYQRKENNC